MTTTKDILLVEDDSIKLETIEKYLREQGWVVWACERPSEVRKTVTKWLDKVQVAVIDHRFTDDAETGQELGLWIKEVSHERISTILWTAHGDEGLATLALQSGFDDYWTKAKSHSGMLHSCEVWRGVSETRRAKATAEAKADQLQRQLDAREIRSVGGSPAVVLDHRLRRTVIDIGRTVGPSLMPVLIVGETGTGKESIAREVHETSGLPTANFRAVNCAAFTDTLLMSELFGHVKGSFTGADSHRLGVILEAAGVRAKEQDSTLRATVKSVLEELWKVGGRDRAALVRQFWSGNKKDVETFYDRVVRTAGMIESIERVGASSTFVSWLELCGNSLDLDDERGRISFPGLGTGTRGISGTLFLDEVADLSKDAQAALLRFLDGNGIRPVGYSGAVLVPHIRVIAATNRTDVLFGKGDHFGSFRTDLLWRLAGWIIDIPPLHERVLDAIGAAIQRANTYGSRATERQKTRAFGLTSAAQERLKSLVNDRRFSGDTATESGNFRNLNWLIDRACWITATDDATATDIDVGPLDRAATLTVRSEEEPARIHSNRASYSIDDQAPMSEAKPAGLFLSSVLSGLAETRQVDISEFQDSDRNLDQQLVQNLSLFLGSAAKDEIRNHEIRTWFNVPHTTSGENLAGLPTVLLPRWKYLFFIACLGFCGRHDGGNFEWKTAEVQLGAKREPFKKEIERLFAQYGLKISFPSTRISRPLRDLAHFALDDEHKSDSQFEVTDKARAALFRSHLKFLAKTVNLTVEA